MKVRKQGQALQARGEMVQSDKEQIKRTNQAHGEDWCYRIVLKGEHICCLCFPSELLVEASYAVVIGDPHAHVPINSVRVHQLTQLCDLTACDSKGREPGHLLLQSGLTDWDCTLSDPERQHDLFSQ